MLSRKEIKKQIAETNVLARNSPEFYYLKNQEDLMKNILEYTVFLAEDSKFSQRLYHWLYEIDYIPKCKICNKESKFSKITKGYKELCSKECFNIYNKTIECTNKKKESF